MGRSIRVKPCGRCSQTAAILYRVKYEEDGNWVFLCRECWDIVSLDNPFYVYGGTWKSKKK
jgi:hypothetical protein